MTTPTPQPDSEDKSEKSFERKEICWLDFLLGFLVAAAVALAYVAIRCYRQTH